MNLQRKLEQFSGTTQYHKSIVNSVRLTDGAKYIKDSSEAGEMLVNRIASEQLKRTNSTKDFQVWAYKYKDRKGKLTQLNHDNIEVFADNIDYPDFPLESLTLWVIDKVLMLPSEY